MNQFRNMANMASKLCLIWHMNVMAAANWTWRRPSTSGPCFERRSARSQQFSRSLTSHRIDVRGTAGNIRRRWPTAVRTVSTLSYQATNEPTDRHTAFVFSVPKRLNRRADYPMQMTNEIFSDTKVIFTHGNAFIPFEHRGYVRWGHSLGFDGVPITSGLRSPSRLAWSRRDARRVLAQR